MSGKRKTKRDEFLCGYACAVATMVAGHDVGVPAEEALEAAGLNSLKALRKAGADEYDVDTLRPTIRFLQARDKRIKKRKARETLARLEEALGCKKT